MKTTAACLITVLLFLARQPTTLHWSAVGPGVDHAHTTVPGPLSIHLLRVDPSRARLDVAHARDAVIGLETTSSIAARLRAVAAVNGGYFRMTGTFAGDSTGALQIDGRLLSEPDRARAAVGLVRSGRGTTVAMGHVSWEGEITTGGTRRRLDGVNRPRGRDEAVLFTPEFHATTLTDDSGAEIVVRAGRVIQLRDAAGSTPIPDDGFVLSTTGVAREWAMRRLAPGTQVSVALRLKPADGGGRNPWAAAEDVLGAGPKLVTAGRLDITVARERILPAFAADRHPRTAIGTLADGRVVLLVVDGRQPEHSIGMALEELARFLIALGVTEAINLDGGGSTTMVVKGRVMNQPSDATGERPVSDAIVVLPLER